MAQIPFTPATDGSIHMRKLVKRFKSPAGEVTVLKGFDLDIESGEFISIVGKSGSGKSTLLNMITGIDHPSSGDVLVGGTHIHALNESQRSLWRGRNMGIVFQFFQLLPMLTLHENTMLPMDYTNTFPASERPARAMELLARVGLAEHAEKLPAAVSSGQQQSAAIARALATNPPILVADEPTGNLDSRSADNIIQLFQELADGGKTILIVTHDPSITAHTHRTVIISDGEIIDETVTQALPLLSHPQMLKITKLSQRRTFQPGASILVTGDPVNNFFIIKRGEVEVLVQPVDCPTQPVASLGAGEFFGEVELMGGGNAMATIRAAGSEPVELLVLLHDDFIKMLAGSPMTEETLTKIVQHRLAENRAARQGCK